MESSVPWLAVLYCTRVRIILVRPMDFITGGHVAALQGYFMQMLSAKLGVATGQHLAELCRCASHPPTYWRHEAL